MKYHLKKVLKEKEECYIKLIGHCDRNIGKSVALARLSAKYDIPVVVLSHSWKRLIENDIPKRLPKYFKFNKPKAIVLNENSEVLRHTNLFMEEGFNNEGLEKIKNMALKGVVGYKNI